MRSASCPSPPPRLYIASLQRGPPHGVRRDALRHPHRGEHRGMRLVVAALRLEAPMPHRGTRRFRRAAMAAENGLQALLVQHADGDLQALEEVGGGRIGECAAVVGGECIMPIPIAARQPRALAGIERLVRNHVERQARRQHQAFLRAADRDIDAPFVVAIVDRAGRRHDVHHQQRGMIRSVDGLPHRRNVGGHAGRGLVVDDAHRLDAMRAILGEARFDRLRVDGRAPIAGQQLRRQPRLCGEPEPQGREPARFVHQHAIAGR